MFLKIIIHNVLTIFKQNCKPHPILVASYGSRAIKDLFLPLPFSNMSLKGTVCIFTFTHFADAFMQHIESGVRMGCLIQSDLHCIILHILSEYVQYPWFRLMTLPLPCFNHWAIEAHDMLICCKEAWNDGSVVTDGNQSDVNEKSCLWVL